MENEYAYILPQKESSQFSSFTILLSKLKETFFAGELIKFEIMLLSFKFCVFLPFDKSKGSLFSDKTLWKTYFSF